MASDLQAPSSQQAAPVGMLPNPFKLEVHQPPNTDQVNLQGRLYSFPGLARAVPAWSACVGQPLSTSVLSLPKQLSPQANYAPPMQSQAGPQGSQALDSHVVNLAMTFIPTGESSGQVAQLEHQAQAFCPVDPASELQAKMQQDPPKPMQVGTGGTSGIARASAACITAAQEGRQAGEEDVAVIKAPKSRRTSGAGTRSRGRRTTIKGEAEVKEPKGRSSKYRGVTKHKRSGRWEAHIWVKDLGRQVYLGGYEHEDHAAEAFDVAALKCKGSESKTNFESGRYTDLTRCMDSISLEELIMAVRRQSQGFSRGTSTYRGVTHHSSGRWEARIGVPGSKHIYLGLYHQEDEAARAYDRSLVRLRGITAATNFALSDYKHDLQDYHAMQQSVLQSEGEEELVALLGTGSVYERWIKCGTDGTEGVSLEEVRAAGFTVSGTPEPVTATSAVPVQAPAGRRRRAAAPPACPDNNDSGSDYEEEMQVRREPATRSEPNSSRDSIFTCCR